MLNMINTSINSYSFKWYFPLLWIAVNTLISPIAIFAGLAATYIAAPWSTGPIDTQTSPDSLVLLILRSLAFAVIAGGILEVPRWLLLRQFINPSIWIPITITGLAIAVFIIYQNQSPVLGRDWMWPNCLANWSSTLLRSLPLVLPGIFQSVILAREHHRWYFWLIAGSTSYILPLVGFTLCPDTGFLAGSFLAAIFTVIILPITLKVANP